jgi:hypothetical protein
VKVGDLVVIRRGANAWGVVTAVKPKARKGVAGTLDVSIQSTHLLTGVRAPLRAEEHLKGGGRSMKSDSAEALADSRGFALPLLPLIRLEKGNDVTLPEDAKVTAYVNGDVVLSRLDVERVQPPPVQRAGPATITIFRTSNSSGSFSEPSLYCGNVAVTQLWNGRYFRMRLPRGSYYFQSNENQVLELHVEEGQEFYLQMQMAARGFGTKGHLVQVSNAEGEDEVAHLREMSAKNVAKISDASLADLQAVRQKK